MTGREKLEAAQPREKVRKIRSRVHQKVEELRGLIWQKHDIGMTWAEIAEALSEADLKVTPGNLTYLMGPESKRDFAKYPRSIGKSKKSAF